MLKTFAANFLNMRYLYKGLIALAVIAVLVYCCHHWIWVTALAYPSPVSAVGSVLSGAGAIITSFALLIAADQLRTTKKAAKGEFFLKLVGTFKEFNDIDCELDHGKWSMNGSKIQKAEDLYRIKRYMGFLEHIEVLIRDGMIDTETVDQEISHRIHRLVAHPTIQQECFDHELGWVNFIALWKRLDKHPVFRHKEKRLEKQEERYLKEIRRSGCYEVAREIWDKKK